MGKKVTQQDIARALNLGINTVNRAFTNTGYVSKKLKKKIFEYAQDVNYVVNKAAQSLVRGESRTIALFSSEKPDFFWNDIQKGVEIAKKNLEPFNINVLYIRVPAANNRAYIKALRAILDDGVHAIGIVNNSEYDIPGICSIIEDRKVPYIAFNIDVPSSRRICYIGPDYMQGGKLAANFLGVGLQGKGLVLVVTSGSDKAPSVSAMRLSGFQTNMAENYPSISYIVQKLNEKDSPQAIKNNLMACIEGGKKKYDGIYLPSSFNLELMQVLEKRHASAASLVVAHDLFPGYKNYFDQKKITALIYQNPILQGYDTVKMLEHILGQNGKADAEDVLLHSSILLRENCDPPVWDIYDPPQRPFAGER
jgi:LacI family transcriptional regulator